MESKKSIKMILKEEKNGLIIVGISTLLMAAVAGIGILKSQNVEIREKAEALARKLERQESIQEMNRINQQRINEYYSQQKPATRTYIKPETKQPAQQQAKLPKATTIKDLPPSKNPISIYTPPTRPQTTERQRKQVPQAQTINVRWRWPTDNKAPRKDEQGVFRYTISKSAINTATVCNNYSYGSITYRNCRKSAKQYFADNCSQAFIEACGAQAMRP